MASLILAELFLLVVIGKYAAIARLVAIFIIIAIIATTVVAAFFLVSSPPTPQASSVNSSRTVSFNQTPSVRIDKALGPIPPFTLGAPNVRITMTNAGNMSIVSIMGTLKLPSSNSSSVDYLFHFNVSSSNPLKPGSSTSSKEAVPGAIFQPFQEYSFILNGTAEGNQLFSTHSSLVIYPLDYLVPGTPNSYCTSGGIYVACFGDNFSSAAVFNCAREAAASSGCTWGVVDPSTPQYATDVTVWYPYQNSSVPFSNCKYASAGGPDFYYDYCVSLNSTAFVISSPAPKAPSMP
ncbi:MAG: hypothetical protein JRN15_23420 [Nitrososphaerota archaeon]|nr:hypothetical protein [Nitrososphaerota archaeon]